MYSKCKVGKRLLSTGMHVWNAGHAAGIAHLMRLLLNQESVARPRFMQVKSEAASRLADAGTEKIKAVVVVKSIMTTSHSGYLENEKLKIKM